MNDEAYSEVVRKFPSPERQQRLSFVSIRNTVSQDLLALATAQEQAGPWIERSMYPRNFSYVHKLQVFPFP